jgi:hypothetical protein
MLKFIVWWCVAFGATLANSYFYQQTPEILSPFVGTVVLGMFESLRWCVVHQVRLGEQWGDPAWERNFKVFIFTVFPAFLAGSFVGYWASTGVWYHP